MKTISRLAAATLLATVLTGPPALAEETQTAVQDTGAVVAQQQQQNDQGGESYWGLLGLLGLLGLAGLRKQRGSNERQSPSR